MATVKGGEKAQAALNDLLKRFGKDASVKVGFLSNATYPDGKRVAMIAAFNEFGTRRMPPRPFFRNMIKNNSKGWAPALAKILPTVDYDVVKALKMMGEGIKGQLQQSINDLTSPKLAESTVESKGFDKPLINTGHMLNSVDYEVKE